MRRRAGLARFCALFALLALCGCVEATAELAPDPDAAQRIVRREGADLGQASVAIVSVEGAPLAATAHFLDQLKHDAQARDIALTDAAKAHYLLRGYLSASTTEDGASIEYVWDVFTPDKHRAQRLNDAIAVKGAGADPWALAGDAALASVAAKSADDLAAFLSYTPEATPVAAAKPPSMPALSYAAAQ
ncbi:MAG: hypothetical protein E7774_09015 [Bradyrhizobium sp.]|nr:MAG: hypothetical protein E7774_09015 [Bradyrhizobium sp.]